MVLIWYMDNEISDQRLPHKPEPTVYTNAKSMESIGVLYWQLTDDYQEMLNKIREERGYSFDDQITVSKEKLPNYDNKIKSFYQEHMHTDEEVRFILEGSGYFDVRDENDKWLRILVEVGDLIVLPAGIYHRFTCDSNDYIKACRLFQKDPVWTPFNRNEDTDNNPVRIKYLKNFNIK